MRARVVGLLASLAAGASLGLAACKSEKESPDPHSLAALEAEGPPHTPDCRSWSDLDFAGLPPLPPGEHVAAFDQVWQTVAQKHYDPTLGCLDWPALREQYAAKVAEAGDDTQAAYAAINELLALLGQSHLHATAPTVSTTRERDTGPAVVPVQIRWLSVDGDERGAVVVDASVDGHDSGVPRGSILVEVAGESVADVANEVAAAVEARGGRPVEAAFLVTQAIGAMLSCPEGGAKSLTILDPDDQSRTLEVACFLPEGERISLGNLRNLPTTVEWRMIGDPPPGEAPPEPEPKPEPEAKIGYLAFNFWMLPMSERLRDAVAELRERGMQGLVIDLRGNPGGVGAMSIPIAHMFVEGGTSLGRLQMREFNQEFTVAPNPSAFTGPIAILVDEGTASTSEIFALGMRDIGRVTIVGGGPSAGMALPSMIETLPDGGLIQYVVGDYHSAKGTAAEGEGVQPDVRVSESRADFAANRDPVLDAAVGHLIDQVAGRVRDSASAPETSAPAPTTP